MGGSFFYRYFVNTSLKVGIGDQRWYIQRAIALSLIYTVFAAWNHTHGFSSFTKLPICLLFIVCTEKQIIPLIFWKKFLAKKAFYFAFFPFLMTKIGGKGECA